MQCCCDPMLHWGSCSLPAQCNKQSPQQQQQQQALCGAVHQPEQGLQGTLDYILYTSDSLVPCAVLDLPEEADMLRSGTPCLPNESWPSDHIALATEFAYSQQARHADPATFIPAYPNPI